MKSKVIIPMEELVPGKKYIGEGRNSNIGIWNGINFEVVSESTWTNPERYPSGGKTIRRIKNEDYYTSRNGTFKPYRIMN